MSRLRISDSEYYTLRRRRNDNGISFLLSPYSCMSPVSLYLDQIRREISIYLRDRVLYNGILDLSRIKNELERLNRLNSVELSTLLTLIENEPETRRYLQGEISPIDRLIFSLAYESSEELRKKLEEATMTIDYEELIRVLQEIVEELPHPLREPMSKKLKPYLPKKEKKLKKPMIKKKKKKKKKVLIYA